MRATRLSDTLRPPRMADVHNHERVERRRSDPPLVHKQLRFPNHLERRFTPGRLGHRLHGGFGSPELLNGRAKHTTQQRCAVPEVPGPAQRAVLWSREQKPQDQGLIII